MQRLLLLAMIATVGAVSAQDTSTDTQATSAETNAGVSDEDLSSQGTPLEEDEDVFKPTDVVSYAQSVPFPVDI